MKLAIERAALLKSLGHVQSVVERRTDSDPVQRQARGERWRAWPDRDRSRPFGGRNHRGRGDPAGRHHRARAHPLRRRAQAAEGARVAIERSATGSEITLRSGRATFDLPCLPADEFPTMGDEGLEHRFTLPAGELRKLIDRTRFAISTEETRYYLNGIFLPCAGQRRRTPARRGHGRPPPARARRDRAARGRGGHAAGDRAAQDDRRAAQADRRAGRRRRGQSGCRARASASRSVRRCCARA